MVTVLLCIFLFVWYVKQDVFLDKEKDYLNSTIPPINVFHMQIKLKFHFIIQIYDFKCSQSMSFRMKKYSFIEWYIFSGMLLLFQIID